MRKIKFRGKCIDNGEWVYGDLVSNAWGYFIISHFAIHNDKILSSIQAQVIPETVGQFTGLKDCKCTKEYPEGQEIYEGDLVKYKTCEQGKDDEYYEETKVVHFRSGSFGFQEWYYDENNKLTENLYHFSNATSTFYCKNYDAEVIGNIHEKGETE